MGRTRQNCQTDTASSSSVATSRRLSKARLERVSRLRPGWDPACYSPGFEFCVAYETVRVRKPSTKGTVSACPRQGSHV